MAVKRFFILLFMAHGLMECPWALHSDFHYSFKRYASFESRLKLRQFQTVHYPAGRLLINKNLISRGIWGL